MSNDVTMDDLRVHIARLEERVLELEKRLEDREKQIVNLQKTADQGEASLKVLLWIGGAVGALIAAILGVVEIIKAIVRWN